MPYIVMGALLYAYCNDNGGINSVITVGSYWRKPRIVVGQQDIVFMTIDRYVPRTVILFAYHDGQLIEGPSVVGEDNNGGIAVDSKGIVHLTWRNFSVFHNTYQNHLFFA